LTALWPSTTRSVTPPATRCCALAARLTACVREEDLLARTGGDEFAIICTRTDNDHAITQVAQRLLDTVRQPFGIQRPRRVPDRERRRCDQRPRPLHARGAHARRRRRDAAVSRAKELGGGRFEAFDIALRHRLTERMTIEADLRHAVAREQLELRYQPLIDRRDEQTIGFEALLRWRHPEHGLIAPGQFRHIAEQTGMIIAIGYWVLAAAYQQLASLPEPIVLAANLSALQIAPELVNQVGQLIAQHNITPRRLVLEITESLVLDLKQANGAEPWAKIRFPV